MNEPRTAAATAARRADSEHKRERVLTVARVWVDRGQDFSWEQLARGAQVNPGFVHRAAGLKDEVCALREQATLELEVGLRSGTAVTMTSVRAENVFLKRRLAEREDDIAKLKRRLGELLGQERFGPAEDADEDLEARVDELEQQLFEARETLRERDEELDAVRALNQRLLRERNVEPAR
jgi:hypothetical protein